MKYLAAFFICFILGFLFSVMGSCSGILAVAAADDVIRTYRLPEGTRLTVAGETYQAYNLGEYMELLRIDADLEYFVRDRDMILDQLAALELINDSLELSVESLTRSNTLLSQERDRLSEKWEEENRLRHEAENRPVFGSWVAWSLAGLSAVTAVVLGVVVVTD